MVPQVSGLLGYRLTSNLSALVGYDFLNWNDVVRAGNQIDRTPNLSQNPTLGATGGTPPYYLWRLSSAALPKGLTLNELTGVISGTPTRVAKATIKVRVTNLGLPSRPAPASSATKTFTLKIS